MEINSDQSVNVHAFHADSAAYGRFFVQPLTNMSTELLRTYFIDSNLVRIYEGDGIG